MKLSDALKVPLTMAKFLSIDDLAKRALGERAKAAAALSEVDAAIPELEKIVLALGCDAETFGTSEELEAILDKLKAATKMPADKE